MPSRSRGLAAKLSPGEKVSGRFGTKLPSRMPKTIATRSGERTGWTMEIGQAMAVAAAATPRPGSREMMRFMTSV